MVRVPRCAPRGCHYDAPPKKCAWSLLRDMKPEKPGPLYVAFSSPYPVTSATIQLYAAQARMNLVNTQRAVSPDRTGDG